MYEITKYSLITNIVRVALRVYDLGARGSGRTHNKLKDLETGDTFIAISYSHARTIQKKLLSKGVKVKCLGASDYSAYRETLERLRGTKTSIILDHTVEEILVLEALDHVDREIEFLRNKDKC